MFDTAPSSSQDNKSRSVVWFPVYIEVLKDTIILGSEENVFPFVFIKNTLHKALTQWKVYNLIKRPYSSWKWQHHCGMLTISLMLEFSSVAYGLILKFGFIGTSLWHVAACESNCGGSGESCLCLQRWGGERHLQGKRTRQSSNNGFYSVIRKTVTLVSGGEEKS